VPGDRVDMLVTVDNQQGSDQAMTRTILQNIEVLAAGVKTEQKDQENKPNTELQTVTLLVDPPSAEKMALAMFEGRIHLTLRNPEDADTLKMASISTRQMLGGSAPPAPSSGRATRSAPRERVVYRDREVARPQPVVPVNTKVTVIKGGKSEEKEPANK
jgi:pilus assembly protein CpaB